MKGVEYKTTDSRDKSLGEVTVDMTVAYKKVSSRKRWQCCQISYTIAVDI